MTNFHALVLRLHPISRRVRAPCIDITFSLLLTGSNAQMNHEAIHASFVRLASQKTVSHASSGAYFTAQRTR